MKAFAAVFQRTHRFRGYLAGDAMGYHEIVEGLAKGRFGASEVVRVAVLEDHDWTEQHFIDVLVVWDDTVARFDASKAAGFKRDLRAALALEDGSPFPVVSFIAKSEDAEAALTRSISSERLSASQLARASQSNRI